MVICGRCGGRMTVRYHTRNDRQTPEYVWACDEDRNRILNGFVIEGCGEGGVRW